MPCTLLQARTLTAYSIYRGDKSKVRDPFLPLAIFILHLYETPSHFRMTNNIQVAWSVFGCGFNVKLDYVFNIIISKDSNKLNYYMEHHKS